MICDEATDGEMPCVPPARDPLTSDVCLSVCFLPAQQEGFGVKRGLERRLLAVARAEPVLDPRPEAVGWGGCVCLGGPCGGPEPQGACTVCRVACACAPARPPGPGGGAGCHAPPKRLPAKPQRASLIFPLLRDERDRGGRDLTARGRTAQSRTGKARGPGAARPARHEHLAPALLAPQPRPPQALQGRQRRTHLPLLTGDQKLGEDVTAGGWEERGGAHREGPRAHVASTRRPPGQTSHGPENRSRAAHAVPRPHRRLSAAAQLRGMAVDLPCPSPGRPIWGVGAGLCVASSAPTDQRHRGRWAAGCFVGEPEAVVPSAHTALQWIIEKESGGMP